MCKERERGERERENVRMEGKEGEKGVTNV